MARQQSCAAELHGSCGLRSLNDDNCRLSTDDSANNQPAGIHHMSENECELWSPGVLDARAWVGVRE